MKRDPRREDISEPVKLGRGLIKDVSRACENIAVGFSKQLSLSLSLFLNGSILWCTKQGVMKLASDMTRMKKRR